MQNGKKKIRIGRPTTSLCFFFRAFIFSRHCVNVRLYQDFSTSSAIFRYGTSFSSFQVAAHVFPPRYTTPVVLLSPHVRPRSAIFNPLFALKPVSNPSPDEGRTRMLNPGSTRYIGQCHVNGALRAEFGFRVERKRKKYIAKSQSKESYTYAYIDIK